MVISSLLKRCRIGFGFIVILYTLSILIIVSKRVYISVTPLVPLLSIISMVPYVSILSTIEQMLQTIVVNQRLLDDNDCRPQSRCPVVFQLSLQPLRILFIYLGPTEVFSSLLNILLWFILSISYDI